MNTELIVICKQCGKNPSERKGKFKAIVPCDECQKQNVINRNIRLQQRRKERKVDSHRGQDGKRYGYRDKAVATVVSCFYCQQPYTRTTRRTSKDVCASCKEKHQDERRVKNIERIKANYYKDPQSALRRRLAATLKHMGLSIEWFDNQPKKCGICGTDDPGDRNWCIDHDHRCCPYGNRQGCNKCIRGLLCNRCNMGIGYLNEDPKILAAAIEWVNKTRSRSL